MAKLPNIFPHPFQLIGEPLELSRLASNPEEKRSVWKIEAEQSGAASSFFCRVRPRAPAILKNLDNRLRNDLPSGLSSANVSPNKNKTKTLQRAGKRDKELLKSGYTLEDTGRLMVPLQSARGTLHRLTRKAVLPHPLPAGQHLGSRVHSKVLFYFLQFSWLGNMKAGFLQSSR